MSDGLTAEFDTVAAWTEQAVADLGPDYALPAACRGSGSPSALAWLAEAMHVTRGQTVLDTGAGVGGPAAWLRDHYGAQVVTTEPMPAATAAAHRLFGLPAVDAWSQALPLRPRSVDAAWALGVLDTTPDRGSKAAVLGELARVLRPGGALGLLVLVRRVEELVDPPEGNDFPTADALEALLQEAGFAVVQTLPVGSLADAPVDWTARADRVEAEIERRHAAEPGWQVAEQQGQRIGRLLAEEQVSAVLLHAVLG